MPVNRVFLTFCKACNRKFCLFFQTSSMLFQTGLFSYKSSVALTASTILLCTLIVKKTANLKKYFKIKTKLYVERK